MGVIFALTIGWTAFTAWNEVTNGSHDGFPEIANAIVRGTAPAAPLIPIYALLAITVLDAVGGALMVTARYLGDKFLKPLQERLRKEGREIGREEGREEVQLQWDAWNQRRLEAEQNDRPFDEPPPGLEKSRS